MPIQRLNHAVLFVRELAASVAFYQDVLGFRIVHEIPGQAAFLQAAASTNDHDLGLFAIGTDAAKSRAGHGMVGLYHLAWEVDTLDELARLRQRLSDAQALVGAADHGTTKALYAKDPDGIEFEVSWLLPRDLITEAIRERGMTTTHLDLEGAIATYGRHTRGGVGVSTPALTE